MKDLGGYVMDQELDVSHMDLKDPSLYHTLVLLPHTRPFDGRLLRVMEECAP